MRNKATSAGSTGNAAVRSSTVTDAPLLIDCRDRPAVWRRLPPETAAATIGASRRAGRKAACRPIGPSIPAPAVDPVSPGHNPLRSTVKKRKKDDKKRQGKIKVGASTRGKSKWASSNALRVPVITDSFVITLTTADGLVQRVSVGATETPSTRFGEHQSLKLRERLSCLNAVLYKRKSI